MRDPGYPIIAKEGLPFLLLAGAVTALVLRYCDPLLALIPAAALVLLVLLFRDPHRDVPPVALGIVSPVDGKVVEVETTDRCVVQGTAYRVRIRIRAMGTYTARSPVEGRVMDLQSHVREKGLECPANALWIETDEGESVVMQFHEYRLGIAPKSFIGLGERLGQGARCAYIRLARYVELYLPINGKVYVQPGQKVEAGEDLIGAVPHP